MPVAYGYRDVLVRGYVDDSGDQLRNRGHCQASHDPTNCDDFVYDPIHYLPLL